MEPDAIALAKKIKYQFEQYQQQQQFEQLAKLLTYALQILPQAYNRQIFGYIPGIFRQVEIYDYAIAIEDIYLGEPVVYKLYYPDAQQLYNLPYFYLFCYLKRNSQRLNVYFQSANRVYKEFQLQEYDLSQAKIAFEGSTSAFNGDDISVISISDPGQFIPGLTSSYYVGSPDFNYHQTIALILEKICNLAEIKLQNTLLFGSSAGSFGALLSSTYLSQKTNVLAVNSQIKLQYRRELMQPLLNLTEPPELLSKYGDRLDCIHRFKQDLVSIPNIYLLANVNDNLHERNFKFYQLLISKFSHQGMNNQFVFDSYYGVDGHGRPEANSLKAKIRIAREILTMKSY
ncbi:MAG: hypothetical protein AAFO95_04170 [Cyanobacteria bacterium J06600_6]